MRVVNYLNKSIFTILFLLFYPALIFSKEVVLTSKEADQMIKGASMIRIKNATYAPNYIRFKDSKEPSLESLSSIFSAYFYKKDRNYSYQVVREEKDNLGINHLRIIHTYKNIPIEGCDYIIHSKEGKILSMNGYFIPVQSLPLHTISETRAREIALAHSKSEKYYDFQEPIELLYTNSEVGNIYSSMLICYKIDVYSEKPLFRNYVYVNAVTGEIVKTTDRIHEINTDGTAITVYRGTKTIQTDSINPTLCHLHDHSRGQGIHTLNMLTGTNYSNAVEFTDSNNYWNNVNPEKDQYATDAHWGAAKTYDFMQLFGRNSIDNNGYPLNLYIHYGLNYVNAFWDGNKMTFGDGNGSYQPLTSLDITAHEIAHGLTQHTAGLVYSFEPGALNESFSDIFGNAVEYFADSLTFSWNIGEDIGAAFRSMSNPNAFNDPDTYLGTHWYTGSGDNGGVHTNSGVQNFWYFLLSMGGFGTNDLGDSYNVAGIGRNKANAIAWRNLTVYLTSQSDYSDARFYSIQSAVDLYGSCSSEVASTTNAWYAVGVGSEYVNDVIADFTASPTEGCQAPFPVTFNNNTMNGLSYVWDFGDGQTSTDISPSHIYTTLGQYTVTLYANGGSCGLDTLISNNLISIDSSNLCTVLMPASGQAITQTSCEGRLIDNGGTDLYSDDVNSSITIAPPGAAGIMLVFRQFKTEPTYDYLYIHEGYNTSGFLLEALTGTTIPDTVYVFSGAVTLRFYSDQFVVDSGFILDWYCIQPSSIPTANFKAKDSVNCRGYIEFLDLSSGGVDSWLWNFGDGNTSNEQNPGHLYSQNGTYNVSLIVSNSYGSDTFTKLQYITINLIPAPIVNDAERCDTGQVLLTANSTNIIRWYDALNPNSPIFEGDTFQPNLQTDSSWFLVEEVIPTPIEKLGPTSNLIGGGSYHTGGVMRGQKLKANKICALKSAFFYSNADGFRTILLLDSTGVQLETRNVFIPNGNSRVEINFILEKDKSYIVAVEPSFVNLYRNTSGAIYPYNTPGNIATILDNTSGEAGRYYFFYDMEILQDSCFSEKDSVLAVAIPFIQPTITQNTADSICFGSSSKLTLSPENASYLWNNGDTTNQIFATTSGSYFATVQGCGSSSDTVQITVMPEIKTDSVVQNASCFLGSDGYIQISPENPNHQYSYYWNTTASTSGITNLTANSYHLTVTDLAGCTSQSEYNISQPNPLIITSTATPKHCFGTALGSIACSVSGGIAPYSALWSDGDTSFIRFYLEPGFYYVTITDSLNCSASDTVFIDSIENIQVQATINPPTCSYSNNGSIQLALQGGLPSYYTYWINGSNSTFINNLYNGAYTVTISDSLYCIFDTTFYLATDTMFHLDSIIHPICFNDSSGSITIYADSSYNYNWSNGGVSSSQTQLTGGVYSVTISNTQSCTISETYYLNEPTPISIIGNTTQPLCFNDSTGSITINISGGTGFLHSMWNDNDTSYSRNHLSSGNYSVTITDENNCTASENFVLLPGAIITLNPQITPLTCYNGASASIVLNPNGGTGPYNYFWLDGSGLNSKTGLTAGSYSVTVTDQNGCTDSLFTIISNPDSLVFIDSIVDVRCYNENNGSIILSTSGGVMPYNYSWSNGTSYNELNNLTEGIYSVTVTDSLDCPIVRYFQIHEPDSMTIDFSSTNPSCYNFNDGSITALVSGGNISQYSYQWSNGNDSIVNTLVTAGLYSVSVTDAKGCTISGSTSISEPNPLQLSFDVNHPTCFNTSNGSITALVNGGTLNYYYEWSNQSLSSSINNLTIGTYYISVSDNNGCTIYGDTTLTSPDSFSINETINNVDCYLGENGSININVSGGTAPITYLWNTGATQNMISGLQSGSYNVTITDLLGCSANQTFAISAPDSIEVNLSTTDATDMQNNGTASALVSGGTSPYDLSWTDMNNNTVNPLNLYPGSYILQITDENNCEKEVVFSIGNIVGLETNDDNLDIKIFPNPANSKLTIKHRKGVEMFSIFDIRGRIAYEKIIDFESEISEIDCSLLSEGSYTIRVQLFDRVKHVKFLISR